MQDESGKNPEEEGSIKEHLDMDSSFIIIDKDYTSEEEAGNMKKDKNSSTEQNGGDEAKENEKNLKVDSMASEKSNDQNLPAANHGTKGKNEDKHSSTENGDTTKQDESEKTLTNEKNVRDETSRSEQKSDQNNSETDHETEREEENSDVAIHRKVSEKHERMKQSQYCNRSGPEKYIRSHTDVEEQMDWEVNHQMENNSNVSGSDEESNLGNKTETNRDEEDEQSESGSGQQNICRTEEEVYDNESLLENIRREIIEILNCFMRPKLLSPLSCLKKSEVERVGQISVSECFIYDLTSLMPDFLKKYATWEKNGEEIDMHPIDIRNTIFRHINEEMRCFLTEKLFALRLAIPFVLQTKSNSDERVIFVKNLLSIKCEDENHKELLLSSYPLPIITFARLGDLPKSKSDIMNHILMDGKRDVFYNYNMKNGDETKL
ncbi:hypothetical protein Ciccas_010442, partial [Cichlidogyrus casuarinus]